MNFLGDKGLFQSMTVWGLLVWQIAPPIIETLSTLGLVDAAVVATLTGLVSKLGALLTGLGVRRAIGAKPAA